MKIFILFLLATAINVGCSMGKNSVTKRDLFKNIFWMSDKQGVVYTKECPKRAKSGRCKVELVKKEVNFCEGSNFKEFARERYILVKESDFLM